MTLWADIGLLLSLAVPLVFSIYKETRFVTKKNAVASGIALIVFSLSYTAYELPKEFSYLANWHWIFLMIGIALIYISFRPENFPIKYGEEWRSLVFSWKNFGAFELAFLSPVLLKGNLPRLPINLFGNFILNLGLNLFVFFWCLSIAVLIYNNFLKEKD